MNEAEDNSAREKPEIMSQSKQMYVT